MFQLWMPVQGYEDYQISTEGNIISMKKQRYLKPLSNGKGYLMIGLYKDGKRKAHKIHRLVAQAFIPNPDGLLEINHKDENKYNNTVSNLEWCDRRYNANYGTIKKRISDKLKSYR